MLQFELTIIPFVTLFTVILCIISASIIHNRKLIAGYIGVPNPSLVVYISSANGINIPLSPSWCNRIILISADIEIPTRDVSVFLPNARDVPEGSVYTIYNNPASLIDANVTISYAAEISTSQSINYSLGRGQGAKIFNTKQIFDGLMYVYNPPEPSAYTSRLNFSEVQPLFWKVYENIAPDPLTLCSDFNNGPTDCSVNSDNCPPSVPGYDKQVCNGSQRPCQPPEFDLLPDNCSAAKCTCPTPSPYQSVWCCLLYTSPSPRDS